MVGVAVIWATGLERFTDSFDSIRYKVVFRMSQRVYTYPVLLLAKIRDRCNIKILETGPSPKIGGERLVHYVHNVLRNDVDT